MRETTVWRCLVSRPAETSKSSTLGKPRSKRELRTTRGVWKEKLIHLLPCSVISPSEWGLTPEFGATKRTWNGLTYIIPASSLLGHRPRWPLRYAGMTNHGITCCENNNGGEVNYVFRVCFIIACGVGCFRFYLQHHLTTISCLLLAKASIAIPSMLLDYVRTVDWKSTTNTTAPYSPTFVLKLLRWLGYVCAENRQPN